MQYLAVVALLGVLTLGEAKYAYTEVAATTDGKPCVTDCIDGKCIAERYGTEKTCTSSGVKAPMTFSTTQYDGKDIRPHCLSNCGSFENIVEWCYTSEEGDWDYCNSSPDRIARTIDMRSCKGPCTKDPTQNYAYRCEAENGRDDEYCAPPATSNEPKVDANKEHVSIRKVGYTCTCSSWTCSLPGTNP